jgi:hypothetical protein
MSLAVGGHLVVAVHGTPSIVCPEWCTDTNEDHVADLSGLEGFVIHRSAKLEGVELVWTAYADGAPEPTTPPVINVSGRDEVTPAQGEAMARRMLEVVRMAEDLAERGLAPGNG